MARYVELEPLVAEINKLKNISLEYGYTTEQRIVADVGKDLTLKGLLDYTDTLEVKEVDINKEISQFIDANFEKATIGHKLSLRRVAKRFFELGMAVSDKEEKGEL